MSLYRKYRPQNFEGLVGQDAIRTTLVSALKLSKVHHAYLFTGPRGTGKTSTARILAKALNCLDLKDTTPCEKCEICRDIADGRLIDVIEIDAASNRGIDEMRDLREKINFAPTRAKNKIYIIDEVHMLTKEAFNALLKTLEEPPSQVYFILATTEVHKIPETIISRCQRFDFKRIDEATLISQLEFIAQKENIAAEKEALQMIALHAQGGLRDAIGLMEQLTTGDKLTFEYAKVALGMSDFQSLGQLFVFLEEKNTSAAIMEIANLHTQGLDLIFFNKNFLEYLRKQMLLSVEKGQPQKTAWLIMVIENFQQAYEQSRSATIQQLPLEIAIVKSCLGEVTQMKSAIPNITPSVSVTPNSSEAKTEVGTKDALTQTRANAPAEGLSARESSPPDTATSIHTPTAPAITNDERIHQSIAALAKKHNSASLSIPKTATASGELTFESVQKAWKRIGDILQPPMVKRSFQEVRLGKVENNEITLLFSAQFHLEKLMQTANRLELEKGFEQILGQPVKIKAIHEATAEKVLGKNEPDLASSVADIFGGEVM